MRAEDVNRLSAAGLGVFGLGMGWILAQAGCAGTLRVPGSLDGMGRDLPTERRAVREPPSAPPLASAAALPPRPTLPPWVREQTLDVGAGGSAPLVACEGESTRLAPNEGGDIVAAPVLAAPVGAVEPSPSPFDPSTMLRWDVGGPNEGLPDSIRAALGLPGAFDVAAVPVEPLRGSDRARERLRAAVTRAQDGEVLTRFAFWGASHVAGEYFTGEVRRLLQDRWGDGGHGWVMPAPPYPGYRRTGASVCATGRWVTDFVSRSGGRNDGLLGVTGMRVEPIDADSAGRVSTAASSPNGRTASRIGVLWLQQPEAGAFTVAVDGGAPFRVETSGASGPGGLLLHVPDTAHTVEVRGTGPTAAAPEATAPSTEGAGWGPTRPPALLGVALERERGFVLDAMGVSGRTAGSWIAWDSALLTEALRWRPPELFVLAYGTNEAADDRMVPERYRATLRAALGRARAAMPDAACVLIGPSDRGRELRGRHVIWGPTTHIAQIQREVAPEFDCLSWDLQAVMGGPGSMYRWKEAGLAAPDLIHLTPGGYKEVARRFVQALDEAAGLAPAPTPTTLHGPVLPHLDDPTP